jgi:hypothetical protein
VYPLSGADYTTPEMDEEMDAAEAADRVGGMCARLTGVFNVCTIQNRSLSCRWCLCMRVMCRFTALAGPHGSNKTGCVDRKKEGCAQRAITTDHKQTGARLLLAFHAQRG